MNNPKKILEKLPEPLLLWYDENRRILPWREKISPYRTWVSEIMLQQTRVTTVIPYFTRFMEAFPTIKDLAEADTEQLMKLWEGLGYYSRARNLQKAAQTIVSDYDGIFPDTYQKVLALSGIGDYTAGAVLSIAFQQRVPAVDGNVLRVVSRLTGCEDNILDDKTRKKCRELMSETMSSDRPGEFNQALMDLGAMVCLPSGEPLCAECPARDFCRANGEGRQKELPVRISRTKKRLEKKTVFLLLQDGRAALRQRPDKGLLAGLWEYPHVEGWLDEEKAAEQLKCWNLTPHRWIKRLEAHHIFSHIRWEMVDYVVEVQGNGMEQWLWADEKERMRRAVPSAFEKLTREIPEGKDERDGTTVF